LFFAREAKEATRLVFPVPPFPLMITSSFNDAFLLGFFSTEIPGKNFSACPSVPVAQ
jgi:hypothetical protein